MSASPTFEQIESGSLSDLTRSQVMFALTGMALMLLTATIDHALAISAMPHAIGSLNGFAHYSWPTTLFMLTSTIAMPVFAKLSDLYGRKRIYLYSGAIFVASMYLCGAAGTLPIPLDGMNQFIVARGFLGIGNGAIIALTTTLVADLFPPSERGRYQGLLIALSLVAFVIGPGLGGWVTDRFSWRWAYYIDVPFGVIAMVVVYYTLPERRLRSVRPSIDWAGIATLCGWLVPLLLALTWVEESSWSAPRIQVLLIVSAVLLAAFLAIEKRSAEPLLALKLFRHRRMALMSANFFLMGISRFGLAVYLPLFLQGILGVSAAKSGVFYGQYILSLIAGSSIGGHLLSRTGEYRLFATFGAGLASIGLFLLSQMDGSTSQFELLRNSIVCGIGLGVLQPTYEALVQNAAPREQMGVATGFAQFFKVIGGTLGLALFGTMLLRHYQMHVETLIPMGLPSALAQAFGNPLQLVFGRPHLETAFSQLPNGPLLLANLLGGARTGFLLALHSIFFFAAGTQAISTVLNMFLRDVPAEVPAKERL